MTILRNLFLRATPLVFVVLWATGFVVAKLSAGHVEPVSFLAFRFPLAALLLVLLALLMRAPRLSGRDAMHMMIAGIFLHAVYLAPIYWALAHGMPSGVSALIVGLQPLITAFLAALVLGEVVTGRHWMGLAIGLLGVGLVLAPKFSLATIGGITPLTAALCLLGTFGVAFGTVYQKRFAGGLPLLGSVIWQYVGASLVVLVLAALTEDFGFDGSFAAWFSLGWAIFVLSFAAIFLLMMLIRDGEVSRVSSLIFLIPGVAAVMAYFVFDEQLTLVQIVGMLVCAGAVLIVSRKAAIPT